MRNIITLFSIFSIGLLFTYCSGKNKIYIVYENDSPAIIETSEQLLVCLSNSYKHYQFKVVSDKMDGQSNIVLRANPEFGLDNDEAYRVVGKENELAIEGNTERAVIYGAYGLLKALGWSFNISSDIPPTHPRPLVFTNIQLKDAPLKDTRIIFNWHNFLSGCTGWDFEDWQTWIDQSVKIGYNTMMVHAYGNNPMQPLYLNGHNKKTGFLTTTRKGRDWGAQHVNDVRLMHGGEVFDSSEFGSKAAKVSLEKRSLAAVNIMKDVFKYASQNSMDICYAIDVDTWMANPQEIINTFPPEALLEINGYNTVNPEHPAGKRYYEAQIGRLFSDYPEITHLAAWMRRPRKNPSNGSIWLNYDSETLPDKWRIEYFEILEKHPELKDEKPYPGLFAISKIIKVYREILDNQKPEVELMLGSWALDYPAQADPFIPKYCSFIPLDYSYVFDQPDVIDKLSQVGLNRKLYPIVWAHHDDHRYIGRPYKPYKNFNSLLNATNSNGYGVIHWTTHPLDLLFENYERQVWLNSQDEGLEITIENYYHALINSDDENLKIYFQLWFTEGPMFGRETSDYFIRPNDDYKLDGYKSSLEVIEKSKQRLTLLNQVDKGSLNKQGLKEYEYQVGMEKFIISFFNNHHHIYHSHMSLNNGDIEEALHHARKVDPEASIKLYAEIISQYGPTKGEKGILISLNLRWLPDYIDLRQSLGLEKIHINFQPTSHDPLAQGAGHNTFFIDQNGVMWVGFGENEVKQSSRASISDEALLIENSWIELGIITKIPLKTIRGKKLMSGRYNVELINPKNSNNPSFKVELLEGDNIIHSEELTNWNSVHSFEIETSGEELYLQVSPTGQPVRLAGLKVSPL